MANQLVRIDVQNQVGPAALDGVTVRVYQSDGTTFISEGVTGPPFAAGRVEFTLFGDTPAAGYVVRLSLDGWRFPAGSTVAISVTDPPAPDNDFGPYGALQGPTAVVATVSVEDDELVPMTIDDVVVRVYSSPADAFISEGLTGQGADQPGQLTVPLPAAADPGQSYIVRLFKPGVDFSAPNQLISVIDPLGLTQTNIFDFVGHLRTLPQSLDPDLCRVSGVLVDQSLRPLRGRVVEFIPRDDYPKLESRFSAHFPGDPSIIRDQVLVAPVTVVSDGSGMIDVELPRGGTFEVHVHGLEHPLTISEFIVVPEQPAFSLFHLLFPYVAVISYDSDPVSVVAGEDELVVVTVTGSNEQVVTAKDELFELLEFSTDDESIATVVLDSDGTLRVSGISAGTTAIQVSRKPSTVAPRRPAVPSIIVTPPVVVVT